MQAEFSRLDFLEALMGDYFSEHQGFLLVRSQSSTDAHMKTEYFASIEALATIPFNSNMDVYFGVCPREEREPSSKHIKYITALWAHLDIGFLGHEGRERIFRSIDDADSVISHLPFKPSVVVESGRGAHIYWLLEKPEEIQDRRKIENTLRTLGDLVRGVRGANLETMLRLPETSNNKIPGRATKCTTILLDKSTQYRLSDFEEFISRHVQGISQSEKTDLNIGRKPIIDFDSHEKVLLEVNRLDPKNKIVDSTPLVRVDLENKTPSAEDTIEVEQNQDGLDQFAWIAEVHFSSVTDNNGKKIMDKLNVDLSDVNFRENTPESNSTKLFGAEPHAGELCSEGPMEDESRNKQKGRLNAEWEERSNHDDEDQSTIPQSSQDATDEFTGKDVDFRENSEDILLRHDDMFASSTDTESTSKTLEEQFEEVVNRSVDREVQENTYEDEDPLDETLNLDDSVLDQLMSVSNLTTDSEEVTSMIQSGLFQEESHTMPDDSEDKLRMEIEQAHDESVPPVPVESIGIGSNEDEQGEHETTETPLVMDKSFFHGLIDPDEPNRPYLKSPVEEDIPGTHDMTTRYREIDAREIIEADGTSVDEQDHTLVDSTIDDIEMSDIDMEVDQQLDALIDAAPAEIDPTAMEVVDIQSEQRHQAILPGISVRWEGDEYTLIPDGIPPPSFAMVKLPIDPIFDRPRKILEIYEGMDRIGEIVVPNLRFTGTSSSVLEMSARNTGKQLQVQLTEKTTGWHLSYRLDLKR